MANNTVVKQNEETVGDKSLIKAIWGGNSALKIYQALEIGKIKFAFFEKESPTNSIDCYMDAIDFASDFIDLINSGELLKRRALSLQEQAKNGDKYAKDIWESRAGVNQTEEIRKFSIQPGTKQDFAFKASQGSRHIILGFSYRELKNLAYIWSFLEKDWNEIMYSKYSLKNMNSDHHTNVTLETMKVYKEKVESSEVKKQEEKPKEKASVPMESLTLKVKTPLVSTESGGFAFQGWSEDNKIYSVIIRKELIDNGSEYVKSLLTKASMPSSMVTVEGGVINDRIYVA